MKKIYLLAAGILSAGILFGQGKFNKNMPLVPHLQKGPFQLGPVISSNSAPPPFTLKSPPLYSENFESVTPPALPNGMTTGGNTGSDFFKTGTNVQANAGGYWPVPTHTKFAMTNDDVCNCDKGADYLELPQFNFTGQTGLSISFAAVDDGTYGGGPAEVQININNAGWTTLFTMDQAPGVTWQNLNVPLTGSDNQSNVKVRFFYNDQGEWGTGFAVDDIVIDLPPSYDLGLTQKYFYGYQDSSATRYYTRIPQNLSKCDTILFGGAFKNKGATPQTNVQLTVNVTGAQTFTSSSTPKAVAAGASDSANVNNTYVATAIGSHNINFTLTGDTVDPVPDNTLLDTIVVTDTVYGRDNNMPFSGGWYGQPGETYIIGNSFYSCDQDSATSISIFIGAFTGVYDQLGNTVNFQLYELDINGDWILMASKDFYDIAAADKGTWLTFPLTPVAPYTSTTLQPGGFYLAAFESLSDTTLFVTGNGAPGAPPFTTFANIAGTWYYGQSIPFIRLNTKSVPNPCSATLATSNTNVSCNGGNNGAINLTINGGSAPFTYNWSNAATTEDLSNLTAGQYSVTVSFGGSCSVTGGPYTITQPGTAVSAVTSATGTCLGSANGAATATPSGGTSPYTYLWSNGQTGQTAINLAAATYNVTVTDSKGCTVTATAVVTSVTVTATAAAVNTSCGNNNGSATANGTGGTSPYNYLWNNAATTPAITGLAAGTYTVTITDTKGCTGTATANIGGSSPLSVTTSSTNAACGATDGSAEVVSPTGSQYTYLWSSNAGSQTTATATGLGAGTYVVTVTEAGACTATDVVSVNNTGAPTITLTSTVVHNTCNGGTTGAIDITVTGGTGTPTISWTGPNGFISSNEDITGLSAGSYTVIATGSDGCFSTKNYIVNEPPAITATAIASPVTCNGNNDGSVNLVASGGTSTLSFSWSNNATTEDISGLAGATYTVTITDAASCTATASATVNEPAAITVSGTVTDNVTIGSIDVTSNATGASYNWTGPSPFTANTEDISGLTVQGTYDVTVTDGSGCSATNSFNVAGIVSVKTIPVETANVSVFPNPNNGMFNVKFTNAKGQYILTMRNVLGQVIFMERVTVSGNSVKPIDLSNISQGIYYLNISGTDMNKTNKIIVK